MGMSASLRGMRPGGSAARRHAEPGSRGRMGARVDGLSNTVSVVRMPGKSAWLVLGLVAAWAVACTPRPATALDGSTESYLTSAAAVAPLDLPAGDRLSIVATTNILADVVRQVAGQGVEVRSLIPAGVDPHTFEPTPADVRALSEADLIFINGLGLEAFVADMLRLAGAAPVIVSASEDIRPLALNEAGHAVETPAAGSPSGVDPHVWLDPHNVVAWTTTIETALVARDPQHAADYQRGARAYRAQLQSLDAELVARLSGIPAGARQMVTDHDEFGYFARRYGFEIVGAVIPAPSTSAEPSAQDVARLERAIRELGVRAIFVSTVVNPQLSQRVADDTGIRLVNLHAHSLTVGGPADTYLDLMRGNAAAIAQALTP